MRWLRKLLNLLTNVIGIISKELGSTEQDLENFKRSAGITDLSSEAQIALTGNAEYEKETRGKSDSDKSGDGLATLYER